MQIRNKKQIEFEFPNGTATVEELRLLADELDSWPETARVVFSYGYDGVPLIVKVEE